MTAPRQPLHATVVATRLDGAWRGVLIRGRSGAGKSDLALRLMQNGWRLVGDDWVEVFACKSALYAAAPATIAGMPRNSKRARERQSLISSRSPCST